MSEYIRGRRRCQRRQHRPPPPCFTNFTVSTVRWPRHIARQNIARQKPVSDTVAPAPR